MGLFGVRVELEQAGREGRDFVIGGMNFGAGRDGGG